MIYKRLFYLTLLVLALFLVLAAAPVLVRERISIDSPEDSYVFNGSDIIWYSDLHDTETARVEGATGDITTDGDITADGDLTVGGTADFSRATVSGITTSTLTAQTTGALTVTGASVLSGTVATNSSADIGGALTYGSDNLYPLGYASADQQVVCGTTTFTATSEIEATGLSTVTYVIASQTTDPASTGALLTVSDPTTSTFILYSWEGDYTAGTTPVEAHWCAVGDQ